MLLLIFGVTLLASGQSSHFPPGVVLCHRSDPDFNKCLGKNFAPGVTIFANGSKYYGIPRVEPLFVEEMVMKGGKSQSISIEQKYTNAYVYGITTSSSDRNFKIDLDEKCGLVADVETPVIRMEADYELKGKLLLFPINGHGKCNITMYNLLNTHTMVCEKYAVKGKTYLRVTNYTMNMRLDNITYDFQNIFPGNEQISAEILKTVNENGLALFDEVKSGFEETFSAIHLALMNKFFEREPISEIFLD